MTTTLILVRHGRTAWNKDERFRGRTDLPLDQFGLRQAEAVGCQIARDFRPAAVFSSPLERSSRTAEAIARQVGLSVHLHDDLLDLDYGDLSGLSLAEAEQGFPELYQAWLTAPHTVRFPRGESLEDVRARAMDLVRMVAQQWSGKQIVLVSHTVVCRVLFCALLDVGIDRFWRFRTDPASISVFELSQAGATLITANDVCHLKGLAE